MGEGQLLLANLKCARLQALLEEIAPLGYIANKEVHAVRLIGMCLGSVLLAVLLLGCPYESKSPLSAPQARAVDTLLTGYWVSDGTNDNGERVVVEILPFNEAEYVFTWTEKESEPEYYRGFQTQAGTQTFWNFNELKLAGMEKSYYFGRSTLGSDGRLTMALVSEDGVPKELQSNPQGLLKFLEAHVNDSSLYEKDGGALLRRPKADEVEDGRLRIWDTH